MKKMLFSAIALVAFTATSMAVEKTKSETKDNDKVIVTKKIVLGEPTEFDKGYCTATADLAEQSSGQSWTYTKWKSVYDKCINKRTKSVTAS
jgi:hypothetical protein